MRIGGSPLRRAVAASVGLHALLAIAFVLVGRLPERSADEPKRGIDTRVALSIRFADDLEMDPVEIEVPAPPPPSSQPTMPARTVAETPQKPVESAEPSSDTRPPVVRTLEVPGTLPAEMLALLRREPAPTAAPDHDVEPATAQHTAPATPVGPSQPTATASEPARTGGRPIHGALTAGKAIVYVLDASGSMGEWGKFDVARRELLATLRMQPESVQFQIIVYSGEIEFPLRVRGRTPVSATQENLDRVAAALWSLGAPAGRSNHLAAVRAALELKPDTVLILSDASDWPAASIGNLMRIAPGPATVCVAKVTQEGVARPVEVK